MGIEYIRRRIGGPPDVVTQTSTATVVPAGGMTVLGTFGSSTADKVFSLARPTQRGQTKSLLVRTTGAQKVTVTVAGATASGFFENSTFRSIVFSSQSTKQKTAQLVAYDTNTWAVTAKSTGASLL